jgi:hypothetical protein
MYRHLTMTELLDLRDHEGTQAAERHVETCDGCAAEFERLHQRVAGLRALPALTPPRDRWTDVRETIESGRRRTVWRSTGIAGLAAAAMLALFVGVQSLTVGAIDAEASAQVQLQQLMDESQRLEGLLFAVEQEPRVMSGMTAATIAGLEDRIAMVDEGIAQAAGRSAPVTVEQLWRERVTLMGTLVNTHVRNVAYVGY